MGQLFKDLEEVAAKETLDLTMERRLQACVMSGELVDVLEALPVNVQVGTYTYIHTHTHIHILIPLPPLCIIPSSHMYIHTHTHTHTHTQDADPALLRFWTHISLYVLETIGIHTFTHTQPLDRQERVWEVVTQYMHTLTHTHDPAHVVLVALYASFLPRRERRRKFSGHMEGVCVCVCVCVCMKRGGDWMCVHECLF